MFLLYKTYLLLFVGRDKGAYMENQEIQNPESKVRNPEQQLG